MTVFFQLASWFDFGGPMRTRILHMNAETKSRIGHSFLSNRDKGWSETIIVLLLTLPSYTLAISQQHPFSIKQSRSERATLEAVELDTITKRTQDHKS